MSEHQDSYLIRALLDNDNAVIGEIYRRYAARIERFVCANSGNADDACDVFQDALLAIAHQARKPGFVLRCPFEAYLYLVCRGKWLNELKRRQRAQVTITEADGFKHTTDAGALADQTLTEEARNRLFVRFFDRLSEKCRAFLKLSWTGLSMEEVSEQMGVSYGYARKKKAECIAQLTGWIRSSPEFVHLK